MNRSWLKVMSKVPCNFNEMSKHVGITFTWFWRKQKEHTWNITPVFVSKQGIQLIKISRTILKSSIAKNFNIWLANIFNVALCCEHDDSSLWIIYMNHPLATGWIELIVFEIYMRFFSWFGQFWLRSSSNSVDGLPYCWYIFRHLSVIFCFPAFCNNEFLWSLCYIIYRFAFTGLS